MTVELTRAQVLAFRSAGHGLDRRRPRSALVAAVDAIGMRLTRHTDIALAARLDGVERGDVAGALVAEELVAVYGPRGAVWVVPTADQGVFTAGAFPVGEASLRAAVPGAYLRRLDAAAVTVSDALDQVAGAVRRALEGGPRPRARSLRR